MIIENVVVSDELKEVFFRCPLHLCHGVCCVEGDAGAPLNEDEIEIIEDIYDSVFSLLDDEAKTVVNEIGMFDYDMSGKMVTPLKKNEECVYMLWENGHMVCVFEKLFNQGVIDFQKPISCHLYPIRVKDFTEFAAVNYDRWDICDDACTLGKELQVPIYIFVKEALIRKFGEDWYSELEKVAEELKK